MPLAAIIVVTLFFLLLIVALIKLMIESIQEGETLSAALLIVFISILIPVYFVGITHKMEQQYHIVLRDSANTILKDTIYTGGDFGIYRNGCVEFADDTKSYCGYTLTTEKVK